MNNSNSTDKSSENSPPSPETPREAPDPIHARAIPVPDRYQITIKRQVFSLTRGECVKLYQALLAVLPNHKETAVETIKVAVGRLFGVSLRDINSHAKSDHVVVARYAAMYLANRANVKRVELIESFDRHYSAITYALEEFEKRLSVNPKLKAKVDKLEEELKELLQ